MVSFEDGVTMGNYTVVDHHNKRLTSIADNYFLQEEFSDVEFVVRGSTFFAHRVIVASCSDVFR